MGTEIRSNEPGEVRIATLRRSDDGASVVINCFVRVSRADFLAAVAAECDAIVIDRAELPGVDLTSDGAPWALGQTTQSAEKGRAVALAFLALAEYLDAHPPVPPVSDEDVETLAEAIFTARWTGLSWEPRAEERKDDYRAQSRRLLATGRVSVTR